MSNIGGLTITVSSSPSRSLTWCHLSTHSRRTGVRTYCVALTVANHVFQFTTPAYCMTLYTPPHHFYQFKPGTWVDFRGPKDTERPKRHGCVYTNMRFSLNIYWTLVMEHELQDRMFPKQKPLSFLALRKVRSSRVSASGCDTMRASGLHARGKTIVGRRENTKQANREVVVTGSILKSP
jgi:hypothetical protein